MVIREAGPRWATDSPIREQAKWTEHAAFMEALVVDGFVVLGGPLGDGPTTMLIVDGGGEDEIRARLADDPWTPLELLSIASIEHWDVLLSGLT